MFTVNRPEIFLSIPVDRPDLDIDICFEHGSPTIQIYSDLGCIDKCLTLQEVSDMIDALTEIRGRIRGV